MKRFLLGALGTLSLAGISLADNAPGTAKAAAPVITPYQPMVQGAAVSNGHNNCAPSVPVDCCDTGCGGGLVGGISALYLRPHFTSNPSLSLTTVDSTTIIDPVTDGNTTTTLVNTGNPDFGHDWSFSPRIWIGFQGQHLGARARWFQFDQGSDDVSFGASDSGTLGGGGNTTTTSSTSVSSASPMGLGFSTVGSSSSTVGGVTTLLSTGDLIAAGSGLYISQWDGEATLELGSGCWSVIASAGARYLYLEQTYSAFHPAVPRINLVDGLLVDRDFQQDVLLSRQTFTGAGPTLGLEIMRGMRESRCSLYASGRGSVLFGRGRQQASLNQFFLDEDFDDAGNVIQVDTSTVVSNADARGWDVLTIGEIELGAQFHMTKGSSQIFVRPALVGMMYWDGGNASNRAGNDFGLVGVSLSAGVGF